MLTQIKKVEDAIAAFKNGEMVIVTDDPDRENEGDLIVPAEIITSAMMSFMIRHSSGIVCLAMTQSALKKIDLPLMVSKQNNTSSKHTPFTVSIDAKHGITTGVSASDRVRTILTAVADNACPDDLVKPGHIFPLQAKDGGVFERQGHTESSVDLALIAGFKPAAVLCELMNDDGSMMRGNDLIQFADQHHIHMLTIDDIHTYRFMRENMITEEAESTIQLENHGDFSVSVIKEKFSQREHMVLSKPVGDVAKATLVRIHSCCTTGDIFGSKRCDCHKQLHYSLSRISESGGILIYLNQEGRDIGLFNKIKSYSLQDNGFDTVDANIELGLPVDARKYYIAANILKNRHIDSVRLLTNNPAKINDLVKYGITDVKREAMPVFYNHYNKRYLDTKKQKLKHIFGS